MSPGHIAHFLIPPFLTSPEGDSQHDQQNMNKCIIFCPLFQPYPSSYLTTPPLTSLPSSYLDYPPHAG